MKRDGRVIGVAIDRRLAVDRDARGGFRGKRGVEALVGTEGIVRGKLRGWIPGQGQEKERQNAPRQGPGEAACPRGGFACSRCRRGIRFLRPRCNSTLLFFHKTQDSAGFPFRETKIFILHALNHLQNSSPNSLAPAWYVRIVERSRAPLARLQQFSCWPASVACQ